MIASARLILSALGTAVLLLAMSQVAAGPATSNGCTSKQQQQFVKTKGGKKCLAQAEKDLISGSSTTHSWYCSSSGRFLCCEYKDGKQVAGSCETIQEAKVPFTPRAAANKPTSTTATAEQGEGGPTKPGGGGSIKPGLLEEGGGGFGPRGPASTGAAPASAPAAAPPVKLY
jgi:hypothetical protein